MRLVSVVTLVVSQLVFGGVAVLAQPLPIPPPRLCLGLPVVPGDDIQAAIDSAGEGATLCLLPGVHRLRTQLWPRTGQTFIGQPGTIMNGAEVILFERAGDTWTSTGHVQQPLPARTRCAVKGNLCNMPFRLWRDGVQLTPVASKEALGPAKFFFDLKQDTVHVSEDPTGRVFELAIAALGVAGTRAGVPADDVTITGLEWQYFANQRIGVISSFIGQGWVIEDNVVHHSHGCGIYGGTRSQVRGNFVHDMGQIGLCGQGEDILVEDNELANNNLDGFHPRWEAGGAKWVNTTRLTVRNNFSHDNLGPGLWTDGNNLHTLYEGNRVENNSEEGIFHEISYDAVIRNNTVAGNGHELGPWGSGIQVSSSRNVEIHDNTVDGDWNGISLIQERRGAGVHGGFRLRNAFVHDNNVTIREGSTGVHRPPKPTVPLAVGAIRFTGNDYVLGPGKHFAWAGRLLSLKKWQALGMDQSGTTQPLYPRPNIFSAISNTTNLVLPSM